MALAWHCVFTKAGREPEAAAEIKTKGFEAYYPLFWRKRIHNHRLETVSGALFPRYIFAHFDRETPGWQAIKGNSRHVFDILKDTMGRPLFVPAWAIDAMKSRATDIQEAVQADPVYAKGQRLRITTGLLAGCEALFEGTSHERRMALLTLMGKRWTVPIKDVEAV